MAYTVKIRNTSIDDIVVDQLLIHSGDPGPSGLNNALGLFTAATFEAAENGERLLSTDVVFRSLGASQKLTHVSMWKSRDWSCQGSFPLSYGSDTHSSSEGEFILQAIKTKMISPEMDIETKSLLESNTLWFNVLALGIAMLVFLVNHQLILDNPQAVFWFGILIATGNILLRLFTVQPVRV